MLSALLFKTEKLRIKVFYFFAKNLSRGVWTVLAFSSYNLWSKHLFYAMVTWTVTFLSKFGSASVFCTLYFKVVKYLSISLLWSFMLASLPLGLYHFFVTVTLLINVHKFACSKFLCLQSFITFKGSSVKIPGSSILCTIHLYSVWIQLAVTLDCFSHS